MVLELDNSLFMAIGYTGAFSPNSANIFYLKQAFKVFNVTFHLVLELRKCSNFHHFFIWILAWFPAPGIVTSTHSVDLGTQQVMGSLQRLSCN